MTDIQTLLTKIRDNDSFVKETSNRAIRVMNIAVVHEQLFLQDRLPVINRITQIGEVLVDRMTNAYFLAATGDSMLAEIAVDDYFELLNELIMLLDKAEEGYREVS